MINKLTLLLFFLTFNCFYAQKTSILVFSKTAGFRHGSIKSGKKALEKMATAKDWHITFSEDAAIFNKEDLQKFDVLFFLNTTGNILNQEQQNAMKGFFNHSKGFVGTHSAVDTEKSWKWYSEMIGAVFKSHPKPQNATLHINKSLNHPAIAHFSEEEVFFDEWYNFKNPVAKHVNVLATLDETTYSGKQMGIRHPITWYHYYDGARVFYTGMGHTNKSFSNPKFLKQLEGAIDWASGKKEINTLTSKWQSLTKGNIYNNWDVFMGVPHNSVKGLPNVSPTSNGMKGGDALGLNNDPKKVFNFSQNSKGENTIHITGEIYGGFTSKQEYENYHLKLKVKWGEQKWEPRKRAKRDSGLLYHCVGPYRKFWNVWMRSQELQIQEGDMGDYFSLSGAVSDIPAVKAEFDRKQKFHYNKDGVFTNAHVKRAFDNEKSNGKWNTIELITYNGTSLHIVNGKVVMTLYNSRHDIYGKGMQPLTRGRIQLQCEGAELYYKDIKIKGIDGIPSKYEKYLKK